MYSKILGGEIIMISANEFVLFYSEIFKYLDKNFGKKEVEKIWDGIRNNYCEGLKNIIKEKGLKGMHEYWSKVLSEEGGKYVLTLTDDEFILDMHYCPSMGKLLSTHITPYEDYCGHCPALFVKTIEECGFDAEHYSINSSTGECRLHIRKN